MPQLTILARAELEVVCFAVANLSPELIKRWPANALRTIAAYLDKLPDHSPHDVELSRELLKFASECDEYDQRRRFGEKEIPPPFPVEQHPLAQMLAGRIPNGSTIESKPGAEIASPPGTLQTPEA